MADYDLLATTEEDHEAEKCPLVFTQSSPSVSSDESREEVSLSSQVVDNSSKYKRLNHHVICYLNDRNLKYNIELSHWYKVDKVFYTPEAKLRCVKITSNITKRS